MTETRILTKDELFNEVAQYLSDDEEVFVGAIEELDSWNGFLGDDRWYDMEEFDELMSGSTPSEIADQTSRGDFNINDYYFRFTIYGVESSNDRNYDDYSCDEVLDELINYYPNITIWDDALEEGVKALAEDYDRYVVNDEDSTIVGIVEE